MALKNPAAASVYGLVAGGLVVAAALLLGPSPVAGPDRGVKSSSETSSAGATSPSSAPGPGLPTRRPDRRGPTRPVGPRAHFAKTVIDLGELQQGVKPTIRFTFKNVGGGPLHVRRLQGTCGCTDPRAEPRVVAPDKEGAIVTSLDTRGLAGRIDKFITVELDDPEKPRRFLRILATIRRPPTARLQLHPEELDLGFVSAVEAPLTLTIHNSGARRLSVLPFRPGGNLRWLTPQPWSLAPGGRMILRARLRLDAITGSFNTALTLQTNDPTQRLRLVNIRGYRPGEPRMTLSLSPETLDLGAEATAGTTATVLIANAGSRPVTVKAIHPQPAGLLEVVRAPQTLPGRSAEALTLRVREGAALPGSGLIHGRVVVTTTQGPVIAKVIGCTAEAAGAPAAEELTVPIGGISRPIDLGVIGRGEEISRTLHLRGLAAQSWPPAPLPLGGFRLRLLSVEADGATYRLTGAARSSGRIEAVRELIVGRRRARLTLTGYVPGAVGPRLLLAPGRLDLGVHDGRVAGSPVLARVTVRNVGDAPARIDEWQSSGLGRLGLELAPGAPTGPLAPGDEATVTLRKAPRSARTTGLAQGKLFVRSGRERRSVELQVWHRPPAGAAPVRIIYSAGEQGEIEPCGCTGKEQAGGLARMVTRLREARSAVSADKGASLFVHAGNLVLGRGELAERRAALALGRLADEGLVALTPGDLELQLGADRLEALARTKGVPLVVANVDRPGGKPFGRSYLIHTLADGRRVGITGVVEPEMVADRQVHEALRFRDPEAALEAVLGELGPRCEILVVLAHAGQSLARRIAEAFDPIDAVIVGHAEQAMARPRRIGRALIVAPDLRGRHLAALDVYPERRGEPVFGVGQDWLLGAEVVADAKTQRAILSYRKGLASLPAPAVEPGDAVRYVGDAACAGCHEAEHASWSGTLHAAAMSSLRPEWNHYDPACTKCHTVGQGEPHGFRRLDLTPSLAGVQCESCHGPAGAHVASPPVPGRPGGVAMPKLTGAAAEQVCLECHNGEHSPRFEFKSWWRRVAHGRRALLQGWDRDRDGGLSEAEVRLLERYRDGRVRLVQRKLAERRRRTPADARPK